MIGDDVIAMKWRPVPRVRDHGPARLDAPEECSPLEARWSRRLVSRTARGKDELNASFLCVTSRTRGLFPRD
jgi:hypothetical protein